MSKPEANIIKPISVEDHLPKENTYVLARYAGGFWHDSDDQEGCEWVVAKFICGITKAERAAMPDCERKRTYESADEDGNNRRPYRWDCFGPGSLFGQEVDYWCPLPRIGRFKPKGYSSAVKAYLGMGWKLTLDKSGNVPPPDTLNLMEHPAHGRRWV